jgi:hypothetical protein
MEKTKLRDAAINNIADLEAWLEADGRPRDGAAHAFKEFLLTKATMPLAKRQAMEKWLRAYERDIERGEKVENAALREREVDAAERQAEAAEKALEFSKRAIVISVIAAATSLSTCIGEALKSDALASGQPRPDAHTPAHR